MFTVSKLHVRNTIVSARSDYYNNKIKASKLNPNLVSIVNKQYI